jgi:hypothetical protein
MIATETSNAGWLDAVVSPQFRVVALFVQPDGCYSNLPWVDAWPQERDARKYSGNRITAQATRNGAIKANGGKA